MSKKILIISQNFYPEIGSAANRMKNIYQLLKSNGYSVEVITTEPSYPNKNIYKDKKFWDDDFLNDDKAITRIKIKTRKYSLSIINRLYYYLEIAYRMLVYIFKDDKKYDIILVTSPAIFVGFTGLIAKYKYKSKLFLDIRDLWPESLKGVGVLDNVFIIYFFGLLEKVLYKKADQIIVNSEGFIKYISEKAFIPNSKITYIPNGAVDADLINLEVPKLNSFKVIYAGNMGLAQDIKLIMELANYLNELGISIDIIGYGMKANETNNYVKSMNLKNVSFIKPKTRKDCLKLISTYQVGIVTLSDKNVFETVLPGKVIDYMTCGVPIVASVSGISKRIIEEEKLGLVSEDRNALDMLNKIIYLYNNKNVLQEMSKNGISYVTEKFKWEKNIDHLIYLIESKTKDI